MDRSQLITNPDGSIYHLGLRPGELAESVIFVGDPARVALVSSHFDSIELRREKREFVSHTGVFKGKRLSVISTGISTDNIDIVMNEIDLLVNFDLISGLPLDKRRSLQIIRLGTSGSLHPDIHVDSIMVSAHAIGLDGLDRYYEHNVAIRQPSGWNDFAVYLNDIIDVPAYVSSAAPGWLTLFDEFRFGTTLTCPGFYGPQGRSLHLKSRLAPFVGKLHAHKLGGVPVTNLEMETAGIYLLSNLLGHKALSVNAILAHRLTSEFSSNPDSVVERMIVASLEKIALLD